MLARVIAEVEHFPLIFFPKVDELVGFGADAEVGAGVVVSGVVVVAVIHAGAPTSGSFAFEEW